MDRDMVWALIEQSRSASEGNLGRQEAVLQDLLEQLPPEEIVSFDYQFTELERQISRADVWAALWLCYMDYYTKEDELKYFTPWVVAQGRAVHATLRDQPERLPEVLRAVFGHEPPFPFTEELSSVPARAYLNSTAEEDYPGPSAPPERPWLLCFGDLLEEEVTLLQPERWQRQHHEKVQGLDLTLPQWLACTDLVTLLTFVFRRGRTAARLPAFDRKMRWFACACCRRLWHLLSESSAHQTVRVAEAFAAGHAAAPELDDAYRRHRVLRHPTDATGALYEATLAAHFTASWHYSDAIRAAVHSVRAGSLGAQPAAGVQETERAFQIAALRDLFGDLFFSGVVQPHWLRVNDAAVRLLAVAIEQEGAFDRLPLLGDALEEAGCQEAGLLDHCRGGGVHVRGCWVIDMLLRDKF